MFNLVNNLKTAGLFAALTLLFLTAGWAFIGGPVGLAISGVFVIGMNLFVYFHSDKLALRAMQARPIGPDSGFVAGVDTGRIYRSVERLSERAGLPMPGVYLTPHDAPNAFATGRSPRHAAVAVTRGLARMMNDAELDGVIAHELAHIKHRDTLMSTAAGTVAGVLAFAAQWFFFLGLGRREGANPLMGFLVIVIAAVGAAVIKSMISRTREFAADAEGARITGDAFGLASALSRLDEASRRVPLVQPNPANNNLFIVEPLAGGGRSLVSLFATHPPTDQRIRALREIDEKLR
jgi:heat shock protein HtpX